MVGCKSVNTEGHPTRKSELVDEISHKVFRQLKLDQHLVPVECGGRMMDQIKLLHWGFFYYKEINLNEARQLLMTTAHQFLDAFNADERIRPYLAVYPLQPEHIEIRIFLHNPNGSLVEPNKLNVITYKSGVLRYMTSASETHPLEELLVETYQEAEAKLNVPMQQAI